eukprot:Platyproteum_vivax@DN2744_c0_g1_i1.p1
MGAELCTCCPTDKTSKGESDAEFELRLRKGMITYVLLQDGKALKCKLSYKPAPFVIAVAFEGKLRDIYIDEINCLLYGDEPLKRVETNAVLDVDKCVAIRLTNGNCIPFLFTSLAEQKHFTSLVSRALLKR